MIGPAERVEFRPSSYPTGTLSPFRGTVHPCLWIHIRVWIKENMIHESCWCPYEWQQSFWWFAGTRGKPGLGFWLWCILLLSVQHQAQCAVIHCHDTQWRIKLYAFWFSLFIIPTELANTSGTRSIYKSAAAALTEAMASSQRLL